MSNHGGRRRGAGRSPLFDDLDKLLIGAMCEKLQLKFANRDLSARTKKVLNEEFDGVEDNHALLRSVPIADRATILNLVKQISEAKSLEESERVRVPERLEAAVYARLDNRWILDGTMAAYQARRSDDKSKTSRRVLRIAVKPRWRDRAIVAVAKIVTRKVGRVVEPSYINNCWKEFRKAQSDQKHSNFS